MNGQMRIRQQLPGKHLEAIQAYLFLTPTIIGLVAFNIWPIFASAFYSLTSWDIITKPVFIGFDNFRAFADDFQFNASFFNTLTYTFVSVPLMIIIPFILALLVNTQNRGSIVYRVCYFLPVITSTVAVATVWFWIYNPDFGLINLLLYQVFGIAGPNWLGSKQWAMPAVIIMSVWKGLGYNMVIFLAGLQSVPNSLYEAARIDGASKWQQMTRITIPMVSPTTFFILITTLISAFQVFEQTYVLTSGGPYYSTMTMVFYTYQQAFVHFRMGYASALAWVLFIVTMVFTFIQMYFQKKWVQYV